MTDELYINGQKVDMGSSGVNLKLNSNILKDISKVVSNNSYTINLPRTLNNEKILQTAGRPTKNDEFPRKVHSGELYRDGLPIVEDAKVHILSVGESIEVALSWGNSQALSDMIDDGKNLNEMRETGGGALFLSSAMISNFGDDVAKNPGVVFSEIDFGLKSGETEAYIHPCVRPKYILNMMEEVYGLNVNIPESRKDMFDHLLFPLTSKNGGYVNYLMSKWSGSFFIGARAYSSASYWHLIFNDGNSGTQFDNNFEKIYTYMGIEHGYKVKGLRAKKSGKVMVIPNLVSWFDDIFIGSIDEQTYNVTNYGFLEYETNADGARVFNKTLEFDVSEGDEIFIIETGGFLFTKSGDISIGMIPDQVDKGDSYPIMENLPPIKCIDFIKALCNILGVYAANVDGDVTLCEFDKLEENKSIARDWSDKMIGDAEKITFQLDDFAQKNVMQYKDDDTVGKTYPGNLYVMDKWLDTSTDLVTLPFAGSLNRAGKAVVPIYKYNEDGELEYEDVEPRILMEVDNEGKSLGLFSGLAFNEIISKFYNTYQSIIKMPVIVKAKFLLGASDIRQMDMAVPIYIKQYGRYYAIKEGTLGNENIFDVELIQI